MKFNRSQFMKERHARARKQRDLFNELTGTQNNNYSDFLGNETPLDKKVVAYDVSYQVSYSSNSNRIDIKSPETFRVYALQSAQTEDKITQNVTFAIQNVRGTQTNKQFNSSAQRVIGDNTKVNLERVDMPRGFEKSQKLTYSAEIIDSLKGGRMFVEGRDQKVNVQNKKSSAKMSVDITKFI